MDPSYKLILNVGFPGYFWRFCRELDPLTHSRAAPNPNPEHKPKPKPTTAGQTSRG